MVSSLFGRDNEAQALREAFELCFEGNKRKPQHHLVLIHGSSGNGKTALATETLRPLLTKHRGLFLSGKADSTAQWSRPYDVFVLAFQQLIQILENDRRRRGPRNSGLAEVRDAVMKEFGSSRRNSINSDDSHLLSSVIPGFEKVLQNTISPYGESSKSTNTCGTTAAEGLASDSGADAVARLRYLLGRLCRTVASQLPLVLFLDDIQWCDRASLQLLRSILMSSATIADNTRGVSLMVICAYRDDEEYMAPTVQADAIFTSKSRNDEKKSDKAARSPLVEFIEECKASSTTFLSYQLQVHDIPLRSVDESTLNVVLSGVYGLPRMEFYSQMIHKVSSGNIYLALQCVRQLCEEGLLYRCNHSNEWKWDFSQLQAQDDATAQFLLNPAFSDIVRHGITQLSEGTQRLLSVASCFGMDIEEDVLLLLFRDESSVVPSVEKSLDQAMDEGLIVLDPIVGRYAFAHDRVQQAAHALIDDVDSLSFEVGYKLWKRCPPSMLRSKIFAIVTLLNKGQSSADNGHRQMIPDDDCYAVARLNLEAGEKAVSIAAFSDATRYVETGLLLLVRGGKGETYWEDEYELTLALSSLTAEVQMFNHNFERVKELADEVCQNSVCLNDRFRVLMTRIKATSIDGKIQEAMDMGTDVLRQLGEKMPSRATLPVLISEQMRTRLALRGKSKETLMTLPPMKDRDKIAALRVINTMFYCSLVTSGCYAIVLATRSIRLCLKHGAHSGSAMSFTMYAYALCGFGNVDEGFRFGELAMSLLEKDQNRDILPCVHAFFYYGVHQRKRPLREGIEGLRKGARVGIDIGDVENAMVNDAVMIYHLWHMGDQLQDVAISIMSGIARRRVHDHPVSHGMLQILSQVVNTLAGRCQYLNSSEFARAVRAHTLATPTDLELVALHHHSALLAYFFGDYQPAKEALNKNTPALRKTVMSTFFAFQIDWIEGLTCVALARQGKNRRQNMTIAKRILKQESKWAKDSPCNYRHMYYLLKAEYESTCATGLTCTAMGDTSCLKRYDAAIEESLSEGFVYVAALAAERAGEHLMRLGDADAALKYWDKANSHYVDWGATAKARSVVSVMKSASR